VKISKEAKDYVEAQFSKELDTAQSILDLQLKATSSQVAFKSQAHKTNIRHKIEYIERLITRKVDLYIQAYRSEGQIITQAEHDEMMIEFGSLIESHIRLIGTEHTNVFSGLSPDQAKAYEERLITGYRGALNIAMRELDLAMTEMRVKEKERLRKVLLSQVYKKSKGSERNAVSLLEMASAAGITELEAIDYLNYLVAQRLVKDRGYPGMVSITHEGILEIEKVYKLQKAENPMPLLLEDAEDEPKPPESPADVKIFIVHGRDEGLKSQVARFLEKMGLKPIILHEQPNKGRTIIEKFLDHSDVHFAVVLLTGDDIGGLKNCPPDDLSPRARQNVILELGFFLGKLGRGKVCAIYEPGVEIPSDYHGVLFISTREDWVFALVKEIKAAGLPLNTDGLYS
jgi:predicted nucleotide-binding protein